MNLLIVWLIVSGLCTGLVLLSIRFAPMLDNERLNSSDESWSRIEDERTPQSSQDPSVQKITKRSGSVNRNVKLVRSDARAELPSVHSTQKGKANILGSFAILRSEEPLS